MFKLFSMCKLQNIRSSKSKGISLTRVINTSVPTKDLLRYNTCNLAEDFQRFKET